MALKNLKRGWELSWSLAKAGFKLRNEGSYLGFLWYLLNPLALFLVLMVVFGKNIGTGIEFYSLYLLFGLIMFNFFSGATTEATKIIISNAEFIKSIKLNHFVLVFSIILQFILSHFFEIVVFAGFMLFYNLSILFLFYYILIFLLFSIFVLGVCLLLASLGAYISDLDNVWRVFVMLLWFASPIFYPIDINSFSLSIHLFNPLAYFMTFAREVVIYHNIPSKLIIFGSAISSLLFFVVGFMIFNKLKNKFAEKV